MLTKALDLMLDNDLFATAEETRDLLSYARKTYAEYYGKELSEEDIRLFSAGGNPPGLTEAQKKFISNRRAELRLANRRAVFHIAQCAGFLELGLVRSMEEYFGIFSAEAPKPLLLSEYERTKEKAG